MADAKPGDNPLTDVVVYKIERFGAEADEYIRGELNSVQDAA